MGGSGEKRRLTCRSALIVVSSRRDTLAICGGAACNSDDTKTATDKAIETTLRHMREMTKNAEHEMHAIILSCKRTRKQTLAALPADG
jgi:hypothetical protein